MSVSPSLGVGLGFGVGFVVGFGAGLVVVDGAGVVVVGAGVVVVLVVDELVSPDVDSDGAEGSGTDVVPWAAEGVPDELCPNEIPPHPLSTTAPTSTDAANPARAPVRLRSIESPSLASGTHPQANVLSAMVTHPERFRLSPAPNRDPVKPPRSPVGPLLTSLTEPHRGSTARKHGAVALPPRTTALTKTRVRT